jgi:hypothetical protein
LEPEVAGELGENTIFENFDKVRLSGEKPIISRLNYEFTGWMGDEILECTPCFIITDDLAKDINNKKLNGYEIEDVEISESDEFNELYPNINLPAFKRIIPTGFVKVTDDNYQDWSGHDFCITQESYLVVTEKVINVLRLHIFDHCRISILNKDMGSHNLT